MAERAYKTMSRAGASSLVIGIVVVVTGVAAGILMIVNGANLLKRRNTLTI